MKENVLVLASGDPDYEGSGGSNLDVIARAAAAGQINARILVGSNRANGSIRRRAEEWGLDFFHLPKPRTADTYRELIRRTNTKLAVSAGYDLLICGHDPKWTVNDHPAPLGYLDPAKNIGGPGVYGDAAHALVLARYAEGTLKHSALSYHFLPAANNPSERHLYDGGPVFRRKWIPILPGDTVDTLKKRVKEAGWKLYPGIIQGVLDGEFAWDGVDPESLSGAILE